ncbi:hypothetical protein FOL47_006775 [Perkinsus chesapeaki]|uniref:Uncharacterized protein n=1 Tax=Perkinsus chesapeaki TaxID=330153 RepID=A0A7J6LPL5_PERCH|nr:hypothetical protein FOL47_006775 [Perkinsus chesapeaki]
MYSIAIWLTMVYVVGGSFFDGIEVEPPFGYGLDNDTTAGFVMTTIVPELATTTKSIAERLAELVSPATTPSPMEQAWKDLQDRLDLSESETPSFEEELMSITILSEEDLSASTTSTTTPSSGYLRQLYTLATVVVVEVDEGARQVHEAAEE